MSWWWWPFVSETEHRRVKLLCLDRGSRLNDAQKLIASQAEELHKLRSLLAGRSHIIRHVITGSEQEKAGQS